MVELKYTSEMYLTTVSFDNERDKNMDKKNEIINAMFYYFSKKGYNTSMSDVSQMVGLKAPSLYSHFNSKDEILYLTIEKEIYYYHDKLEKEIKKVAGKNCEEKLKHIYYYVIDYFSEVDRLRFWRNISLIPDETLRVKCSNCMRELDNKMAEKIYSEFQKGVLNREIRSNQLEGAIFLYVAMIQGIMDCMLLNGNTSLDIKNYAIKTWEAYWEGLKCK